MRVSATLSAYLVLLAPAVTEASQVVFPRPAHLRDTASVAASDRRTGKWRPQVHFSPPENWLNDPNGLFRDADGLWHLYYQYGYSPWPTMTKAWGHATSTDLYSWVDHAIAIFDTPSEGSIFSGSIVVDKANTSASLFPGAASSGTDTILAYFTSWKESEEAQYLAFSLDGGYTFTPYINNPLISLNRHGFRDPKVIFHEPTQTWIMVITLIDYVVFYSSTDLYTWTPLSIFHPFPGLGIIECPQLVPLPRRFSPSPTRPSTASDPATSTAYLLVLSLANGGSSGHRSTVKYIVGSFDGRSFTPDFTAEASPLDFGPDVYATAFFHTPYPLPHNGAAYNPAGANVVSISWAASLPYAGMTPTAEREGWRHCMTAVKEHWVDDRTGRLVTRAVPAPEALVVEGDGVAELKAENLSLGGLPAEMRYSAELRARNPALAFTWRVRVPRNVSATVELGFSSRRGETVAVELGVRKGGKKGGLVLRREGMEGWRAPDWDWLREFRAEEIGVSERLGGDDEYVIEGVIDRSIVEVYADGGLAAGTLVFFAEEVLDQISVTSLRHVEGLRFDFEARELRSVWEKGDEKKGGKTGGDERGEMGEL